MPHEHEIEQILTMYGSFSSWKGDLITKQLIRYSAHTRNELAMLQSLIEVGDNIIDIGAHVGTFSIPFARFNKCMGKIFAFEADTNNYNLLKTNISSNSLNSVIMHKNAVVSDVNFKFKQVTPSGGNSGMYYFLPNDCSSNYQLSNVPVINIDEWYQQEIYGTKIDLIKIDIEGAEIAALKASKNIIQQYLPILYIEINKEALDRFQTQFEDIEVLLASYGYHLFKNIGPRNSNNDKFKIKRLDRIREGGIFFDLLAIHPSNSKYKKIRLNFPTFFNKYKKLITKILS